MLTASLKVTKATRLAVLASLLIYVRASDEAALYDRQIRLWGVEAQNRCVEAIDCLCRCLVCAESLLLLQYALCLRPRRHASRPRD